MGALWGYGLFNFNSLNDLLINIYVILLSNLKARDAYMSENSTVISFYNESLRDSKRELEQ